MSSDEAYEDLKNEKLDNEYPGGPSAAQRLLKEIEERFGYRSGIVSPNATFFIPKTKHYDRDEQDRFRNKGL